MSRLMNYEQAHEKLSSIGEEPLLHKWDLLEAYQQKKLLSDIESIDLQKFQEQQHFLFQYLSKSKKNPLNYKPFTNFSSAGSSQNKQLGKKLLSEGKVGCLIVAGGQGTRLSFDAPKGTYPVTLVKKKSLFQLFAEKTVAAGKQINRLLPLAIMTSPQNHTATVTFFQDHNFFGLHPEQLFFFQQTELPFLDNEGHLLVDNGQIAKGPNGNGTSLIEFMEKGIWNNWKDRGIEYLNFVLIDNPLADPFDAELIGFHVANHCEITVKCIEKTNPEEHVGLLVETPQGIQIIEYSEMEQQDLYSKIADGSLSYRCANIGLFCFNMNFIKKIQKSAPLRWHLSCKNISLNGPKAWKFETFIFDYLPSAKSLKALLYPRTDCFAPLKNISGEDSLLTIQKALLNYDQKTLEALIGRPIGNKIIELDPQFHYPTNELLQKWKYSALKFDSLQGYIE